MLTVALVTLAFSSLALATQSASPVSPSDIQGTLCSINKYGTPGNWPWDQLAIVTGTLSARMDGYVVPAATPTTTSTDPVCTVTTYSTAAVSAAVSSCTDIHIRNLTIPGGSTLDLSKAKPNTVITFEGRTFWEYAAANYNLLNLGGNNITVQGAPCSVLDGNGPAWWDGLGSNGGGAKPDHMISGSKLVGNSVIKNLYIKNAPTHVFSLSGAVGLVAKGIVIDMKDGYKILSNGLEAAHNTDGFDVSSSTSVLLTNNVVFNQDDCVAVTSGTNIVSNNFFCYGGHGLSIGSVGGKSNNNVDSVVFSNSQVLSSQNGCRIKSNSNTNGTINNVTYTNILLFNISIYGIDIQSDYLNGGPTGIPTNGVPITNLTMHNIIGNVQPQADNYYILDGSDSNAATWSFTDVHVVGGNSSCNVVPSGINCRASAKR